MEAKSRKDSTPASKALRSVSNSQIHHLPRIYSHCALKSSRKLHKKPRSNSVKKTFNPKRLLKVSKNKALNSSEAANNLTIDEELARLDDLALKNQLMRIDWLKVQQQMIEMNLNHSYFGKENVYSYRPINLEKIMSKYSVRAVLQNRGLNE